MASLPLPGYRRTEVLSSQPQVTQELTHSRFACEGLCDEFRSLPLCVPQATFADHRVLKKMLDDIRVGTFNKVPTSREEGSPY